MNLHKEEGSGKAEGKGGGRYWMKTDKGLAGTTNKRGSQENMQ